MINATSEAGSGFPSGTPEQCVGCFCVAHPVVFNVELVFYDLVSLLLSIVFCNGVVIWVRMSHE